MPVPSRPIRKEALLVGISYTNNNHLNGLNPLPGAHEDIYALRWLLINKYGYDQKNITTLVDVDSTTMVDMKEGHVPKGTLPTQRNILDAMERLVANKQSGDHIVFAFSGHGHQVAAGKDSKEADGMDEVILPVDCTFSGTKPENFILDDTIHDIFVTRLPPGVQCTLIFDCCHSGTASDLPAFSPSMTTPPTSPWDTNPPPAGGRVSGSYARLATIHDGHAKNPDSIEEILGASPANLNNIKKDVTSWSACSDDQETFARKSGGIFIKAFRSALEMNPKPTHKELLQNLSESLQHVVEERNQKQSQHRKNEHEETSQENHDLIAPHPQLGNLCPAEILAKPFTL